MQSEIENQVSQVLVHKHMPTDGSMATGASLQAQTDDIVGITRVALEKDIRKRLAQAAAALSRAEEAHKGAQTRLGEATGRVPVPDALFNALEVVAVAVRAFVPDARTVTADRYGGPLYAANHGSFQYETGTFTVTGTVAAPGGQALFNGTRAYPIPNEVKQLYAAQQAAAAEVARCAANFTTCKNALAGLAATAAEMKASMLRLMLSRDDAGRQTLAAGDAIAAAFMEDLEKGLK